ncbi:MAG: hypothetical protein E7480_06915 [Ruminococcaceae bacterium]|nr:hypothetical protein [Oscillospiraceae bacterium]
MKWLLGYSDKKEELPLNYKEVSVPTDVQLEFLQEGAEDIFFGSNFKKYEWMEDKWWHFKTTIFIEKKEGFIPVLTFKGIDYGYTIYIDGKQIIEDEGMFTPVSINLSEYEGKEIEVLALLHPIPKVEGMAKDRTQASASCIPAVSYGWDWHPRLVPIGLYDDVELCYKPDTYIKDYNIFYNVTEDLSKVSGYLDVDVVNPKGDITLEIFEAETCVYKSTALCTRESRVSFEIDNPKLWWCVSQGEQNMYTLKLTAGSDSVCKKIGFRKVRLVMNAESVE